MTNMSNHSTVCCLPGGVKADRRHEPARAARLPRAGIEVLARGEEALALGIDGREYTALAILATDQPKSQQELARLMGKPPPIMVAVVDELERKGLAVREIAPSVTADGLSCSSPTRAARCSSGATASLTTSAEVLGSIDEEERAALHLTSARDGAAAAELQASP